ETRPDLCVISCAPGKPAVKTAGKKGGSIVREATSPPIGRLATLTCCLKQPTRRRRGRDPTSEEIAGGAAEAGAQENRSARFRTDRYSCEKYRENIRRFYNERYSLQSSGNPQSP